jgi:hypothetical protein
MVAPFILGIGLMFLTIIALSTIMYFVSRNDIWFQLLWAITAIVTLLFFIPYSYQVTSVQMGFGTSLDIVSVGDLDIPNVVFDGQQVVSDNETYNLLEFGLVKDVDESEVVDSNFCFYYNNSDADNVVFVGTADECGVFDVSRPIYINASEVNFKCVDVDSSLINNNALFGVICRDCNGSNELRLLTGIGSGVESFAVNVSNDRDFSISFGSPLVFWLQLRSPPFQLVIDWFWNYLMILGFLALMFGLRGVVMIVVQSKEVILR